MDFLKYCIKFSDIQSEQDILLALEKTGIGAVIILDDDFRLKGIVSDGDVRRALIDTQNIKIKNLINTAPDFFYSDQSRQAAITHLKKTKRNLLPIVNKNKQVVDVVCLNDVNYNTIENPAVIMAGGLGKRLLPLTEKKPKPLLLVNGKPILERIIEKLIEQGFINFYISINYLGEQIKNYFGDGSKWDVNIRYIEEEKRLGTAGALSKIKNIFDLPFLVMNGDVITDLNFRDLLDNNIKNNSKATMCVYRQGYQIPFGVVEFDKDKRIINLQEKPRYDYYINMGIYVLNPEVVTYIPDNTFYDMPTLFQKLIEENNICNVYIFDGIWRDIGRIDEYNSINLLREM